MAVETLAAKPVNVNIGLGGATAGQFNKFEMHATPKYPLGFKVETADGKVYRYAHFGANTNRGVLVATDVSETQVADTDNAIIAPASAVSVADESMKPGAIGSHYIQFTLASATANQFAGGTLVTTDDVGEGYSYDIEGNTATDNPATGDIRIKLVQKLQVAVDNTTDVSICANPWHDVEVATTATDAIVCGVSCSTVVAATAPYAWVQTHGPCGVLQDAVLPTVGDSVQLSPLTNGAVGIFGGTAAGSIGVMNKQVIVGRCMDIGDSTGHSVIDLKLE